MIPLKGGDVLGTKDEPKIWPTSVYLDLESRATLYRLVDELGMNRSAVVREALRRMGADDNTAEVRRLVAQLERAVTGEGGA